MSHHYSGPGFGFPHGDARLDFTDLFAFQNPEDPGRTILIMDVHPSVGVTPAGPTTTDAFSPDALYEIRIDADGDNRADVTYRVRFSSAGDGRQTATLRRVEGGAAPDDDGTLVVENAPVSTGADAEITDGGGYRFFAGWRSDPFFFDVAGAMNDMRFTGTDFFADKNICAIVLDVPNSDLRSQTVGLWARTVDGKDGRWVQADRGGRPQIAVFLPGDQRDAYLAAEPADDAQFVETFAHSLAHTGGYDAAEARRVAESLLPDILRYDPANPVAYPTNGRALTDDVVNFFLPLLTGGKVKDDKVGPHGDLLKEFPYLGPPHQG